MAEPLMVTRRELRQLAMRQGVALGALEKDYILLGGCGCFEARLERRPAPIDARRATV
jgi:hypothetical protein